MSKNEVCTLRCVGAVCVKIGAYNDQRTLSEKAGGRMSMKILERVNA
jgi:hypothetical protein